MTLGLLSLLSLTLVAAPEPENEKEQAQFAGTWVLETIVTDGETLPDQVAKAFKMTFKGDTYVIQLGQQKVEGTFRLDPAKMPKTIDIIPDNGPDRGKTQPGIYEFTGEKLRICAAQPGKDRPTDFETKGKTGYTMMVLRKQ